MKYIPPHHTLRTVILVTLAAVLALGSVWLVEVMRRKTESTHADTTRNTHDFYVEDFTLVRMDKNGKARYNLTGSTLLHYPQDDSYLVHDPVMHSYSAARSPMVSRSRRATVNNDQTEIHMYENVHIRRPSAAGTRHFELNTTYLLLLPEEDIMKTPKAVTLRSGDATLNGIGMFANHATGVFTLAAAVKGIYPPATRKTRSAP